MQPLSSLLNHESLIAPGVVLLKDGGVMLMWSYLSADLDAATPEELAAVSARANRALHVLGTGHMIHVDIWRRETSGYAPVGHFQDATSWLIDEERREQYNAEGSHFETVATIALTWKPPVAAEQGIARWFLTDVPTESSMESLIRQIEQTAALLEDGLGSDLILVRLTEDNLLTALHRCISGYDTPIRQRGMVEVDRLIGSYDFYPSFTPRVGQKHIRVVAVTDIPSDGTLPAMLKELYALSFPFRWSTRWIAADKVDMQPKIKEKRRQWATSISNFFRPFGMEANRFSDADAEEMAEEANTAVAEESRGEVRYGFYTAVIVIMHEAAQIADDRAREVTRLLLDLGFPSRVETLNGTEAYLGSIPGHGYQNVRKPIIHSLNLAQLLPLWSVWPGLEYNPSDKFPEHSPPLCYAKTTGHTPFRLHLHVADVGNALIVGPIGNGKTTLASFLMSQWMRYEGARVFCFDRDYGNELTTVAVGGTHHNLLEDDRITFCPLAHVDKEDERRWAAGWIHWLLELQGVNPTPEQKQVLYRALENLGEQPSRTLTNYVLLIQDRDLRAALEIYTLIGECGRFFDGEKDMLTTGYFQTFELAHVLSTNPLYLKALLPYLFHHIDRQLDGSPTLILVDEGRMLQLHEKLYEQYITWLTTVRKKNAAVVLTIPSLTTLLGLPGYQTILDSAPTKIFLPNPEAHKPATRVQYEQLGLQEGEIALIADGQPKRDYYYTSPLGRRLFDLNLGPIALALCGANGPGVHRRIRVMREQYGYRWVAAWLREKKLGNAAHQWSERAQQIIVQKEEQEERAA